MSFQFDRHSKTKKAGDFNSCFYYLACERGTAYRELFFFIAFIVARIWASVGLRPMERYIARIWSSLIGDCRATASS